MVAVAFSRSWCEGPAHEIGQLRSGLWYPWRFYSANARWRPPQGGFYTSLGVSMRSRSTGHNIFFGNLPTWVTADDIRSWLDSSDLVCDAVRVIRDFETQESKGYAFVEAPNDEEMRAIIRRFNRAPIDGKLLRAKAAHPKTPRTTRGPRGRGGRRSIDRGRRGRGDSGPKRKVGSFGEALQKARQSTS